LVGDSAASLPKRLVSQVPLKVCCLRTQRGVIRKRLRLQDFDDSSNGGYFVTVCSHDRHPLFTGDAKTDVENELSAIETRFSGATLDEFIVMPDHVHAILMFSNCGVTLSRIIQAFKSLCAARLSARGVAGPIWQRGYYDRIVRNEIELAALREYIHNNPLAEEIKTGEGAYNEGMTSGAEQARPLLRRVTAAR
jgi:REP element-mobilizing transposase RayT